MVAILVPPAPITKLIYGSLAELYEHYIREYVQISPIQSICGCRIHCYEHHFVHMVKLHGPDQERLFFPDEKSRILAARQGFDHYVYEERRAVRLLAALECLKNPDRVVRHPNQLKTADRAFIKEYQCSQYPFMIVMVNRDGAGNLTLSTGQPTRRRNMKEWDKSEILFPKTPQPPL